MELIKQTTSVEEFIEILVKKLDTLTSHSYIAKTQSTDSIGTKSTSSDAT